MKKRQSAFTLVELMIVVALIADLALIGVPSYGRARRSAQNARFASDLRVAASAFEMYAAENNHYPAEAAIGVLPPGMDQYLHGVSWTSKNSFSASWDWDFNQGYAVAAICIETDNDMDDLQMTDIDTRIDNGILATGQFRERTAHRRWAYIIE